MGSRENDKAGKWWSPWAERDFMFLRGASMESLKGMGQRLFAHTAYRYPATTVTIPTNIPPTIISPMGMFISLARNKGPGVGGTRELAMAAPAATASTSSR